MRKQVADLQRQLAVVYVSDVVPCTPEVITVSDLAATPAALEAFEVEGLIADAYATAGFSTEVLRFLLALRLRARGVTPRALLVQQP